MNKVLRLQDFQWIVTTDEKKDGYYSFKKGEWEITIDNTCSKSWTICLCNKFEEVLEEYGSFNRGGAIKIANKLYKSFTL